MKETAEAVFFVHLAHISGKFSKAAEKMSRKGCKMHVLVII